MKNIRSIYGFTLALSIFLPFFLIENVMRLEVEFFQYHIFTTLLYLLTIIAVNSRKQHQKRLVVPILSFFVLLSAAFHLFIFVIMLLLGVTHFLNTGIGFFIFVILFQIIFCMAAIIHLRSKKEVPAKTTLPIDIEF